MEQSQKNLELGLCKMSYLNLIRIKIGSGYTSIGTRWVFRNKLDEESKVIRNKARLVAEGYVTTQFVVR